MNSTPTLRTFLLLGRVSNLPTVWSNCLAGWWLGGGETHGKLALLLAGMSLIYTAGMYLNDAFDEDFDRQRRAERPIPTGKISAQLVWRVGLAQLGLGIVLLMFCGKIAAVVAVLLGLTILLYNLTHKFITISPWLMGLCRFWVYIIAGAAGAEGLNGFPILCGAALALYVVGLSYVARRESFSTGIPRWPLLLVTAPIVIALLMNTGEFWRDALCISAVLGLWLLRCLRTVIFREPTNPGWLVSNLLAGVVLVDWLAVAPELPHLASALVFLTLFALTKWLQKFVPAT